MRQNLEVKVGDVLRFDWTELLQRPPYKLIANLPYNISSQILFKVLEHRHSFSRLVLMFQKEVGERLVAAEGSRNYGILSVLMQTWFHVERVIKVPPGAFFPLPRSILLSCAWSPCRSRVWSCRTKFFIASWSRALLPRGAKRCVTVCSGQAGGGTDRSGFYRG